MKIRTSAKLLAIAALLSWLLASLLGLHSHIPLDGSPATLDASFFKDALDDSYGHQANPHVDGESNSAPAKSIHFELFLLAGFVILLLVRQGYSRARPDSPVHLPDPNGLRPPLRAPPALSVT